MEHTPLDTFRASFYSGSSGFSARNKIPRRGRHHQRAYGNIRRQLQRRRRFFRRHSEIAHHSVCADILHEHHFKRRNDGHAYIG